MVTVSQLLKRDLVTVDSGTSVIEAAKLIKPAMSEVCWCLTIARSSASLRNRMS